MKKQLKQHRQKNCVRFGIMAVAIFLLILAVVGMGLQIFGKGKVKPSEWFKNENKHIEQTVDDKDNEIAPQYVSALASAAYTDTSIVSLSKSGNGDTIPRIYFNETNTLQYGECLNRLGNVLKNNTCDGFIYSITFSPNASKFDMSLEGDFAFSTYASIDDTDDMDMLNASILFGAKKVYNQVNGEAHSLYGYASYGKYNGWGVQYELSIYPDILHGGFHDYLSIPRFGFTLTKNELCFFFDFERTETQTFLSDSAEYASMYNLITSGKLVSHFADTDYAVENIQLYNTTPFPSDPVKDGHTFVGWCYDSDLTRPYDGQPILENAELYAKFEINRYIVTFNSCCDIEVDSQTVDWGTYVTAPPLNYTGYTFLGWYLSDGTKYTNQPIKQDTELTAQWEIVICTVTFYVDDEVYCTEQVKYGTAFTEVVEIATANNLQIMSLRMFDDEPMNCNADELTVSNDLSVSAVEMNGADKVVNTVKNNKQQVIIGVLCGIVLLALIVFIVNCFIRKKRA